VFESRAQHDTLNMSSGSRWTLQGVIVDAATSARKPVSMTNAILMEIQ